jgi:hypothetical protein
MPSGPGGRGGKSSGGESGPLANLDKLAIAAEQEEKAKKMEAKKKKDEAKAQAKKEQEAAAAKKKEEEDKVKAAEAAAAAAAAERAAVAYKTGLKGAELQSHLQALPQAERPSAQALAAEVLASVEDFTLPAALQWPGKAEYGPSLALLAGSDVKEQMGVVYAVQEALFKCDFPKMDVKGTAKSVCELLFTLLLTNEVVDDSGFTAWADDEAEIEGKQTALFQTISFMGLLTAVDSDEEEEEEDFEDIDAPREVA